MPDGISTDTIEAIRDYVAHSVGCGTCPRCLPGERDHLMTRMALLLARLNGRETPR